MAASFAPLIAESVTRLAKVYESVTKQRAYVLIPYEEARKF